MRGYSPPSPARAAKDLEKYTSLGPLSEGQLVRLIEWDRPHQAIRKATVRELLGKPVPEPWSDLGSRRSSEALFAFGKFLSSYQGSAAERFRFRSAVELLRDLCETQPAAVRTIVGPAVRALRQARRRGDDEASQALEGLLLLFSRRAPSVVVSGVLNCGNPRFRGNWKKGKKRWRRARMARAIDRAAHAFREVFIVPASDRLNREGYPSMVSVLSQIGDALDSVVRAAKAPEEEASR